MRANAHLFRSGTAERTALCQPTRSDRSNNLPVFLPLRAVPLLLCLSATLVYRMLFKKPGETKMNIYQNMANSMKNQDQQDNLTDRRLWTAVLLQALEDWKSGNLRLKRAAEEFFFKSGDDFARVCRGAGLAPEGVLSRLQAMKAAMAPAPSFSLRQAA